ncbi:hypothetical protein OROGR_007747 [Orobanche gracilis]
MEGGRGEGGNAEKVMEGVASIALLPGGSISGHFIQIPNSICYGLHGYDSRKERDVVVECRGHDAAKICTTDHAHGWQNDVVGMLEEKHGKSKVSVSFECETLKAEKAAEDHLIKFMPKLVGMDAVVNIGPMTITGLDFDADTEPAERSTEFAKFVPVRRTVTGQEAWAKDNS